MSHETPAKTSTVDVQTGNYLVGDLGIYKVGHFVGEGSFGKVAKCTKLGSTEALAIKILPNDRTANLEVKAMRLIEDLDPDKSHLMKLYESFKYKDCICLVYEFLQENLDDFLERRNYRPPHLCDIRAMAQQMLEALVALKSINVTHGDIKLDNIMFISHKKQPLGLKLIDFGWAMKTDQLRTGYTMQALPLRAPEVILGLPLDESIDIFSLGMSLISLYATDYIFPWDTEYSTIQCLVQLFGLPDEDFLTSGMYTHHFFCCEENSSNPGWRLNTPAEYEENTGEVVRKKNFVVKLEDLPNDHKDSFSIYDDDDHQVFLDFIKRMLVFNPKDRVTPSQALNHDFITMKHLSGESKASYATIAKSAMRDANLIGKEEDPPAVPVGVAGSDDQSLDNTGSPASTTDTADISDEDAPSQVKSSPKKKRFRRIRQIFTRISNFFTRKM